MRILGIDPGIAITGWGVVVDDKAAENGVKMVSYGTVETPKGDDHPKRLNETHEGITQVIKKFEPDYVAIESLFFFKNQKTAIAVGEARGVVLLAIEQAGIPIKEFTPLQVKDAVCGYGRADKKQVQSMVASILGLKDVPKPDDAADGLAVAICCLNSVKMDNKLRLYA